MPQQDLDDQLRRLSLNDESMVESVLGSHGTTAAPAIDPKTASLVRLAALLAMDAETPSYQWAVSEAIACGATQEELVAVLITTAPAVGQARVVSAAPKLGLALGHDLQAELEAYPEGATRPPARGARGSTNETPHNLHTKEIH